MRENQYLAQDLDRIDQDHLLDELNPDLDPIHVVKVNLDQDQGLLVWTKTTRLVQTIESPSQDQEQGPKAQITKTV